MLSQLVYSSRSAVDYNGIREILSAAREKNARLDLTGALLFSEDYFLQCLEGSREAVTELFGTIVHDPRHTDVQLISVSDVDERSFPDWTMRYVADSETIRPLIRRFLPTDRFDPGSLSARSARLLIHAIVDRHGATSAASVNNDAA